MTNNERERAVKRLKEDLLFAHETAKKHGGTADRSMFSVSNLRLLLSERAELLAAVERMRGGLEKIAAYYPPGHRVEELARAALTTGEGTSHD